MKKMVMLLMLLALIMQSVYVASLAQQVHNMQRMQRSLNDRLQEQRAEYRTLSHPKVMQDRTVDYLLGRGEWKGVTE